MRIQWTYLCSVAAIYCSLGSLATLSADSITIEVEAGKHDREGTPVFFELPKTLRRAQHLKLIQLDDDRPVPLQRVEHDPPMAAWLIRDTLKAGESRRYHIEPAKSAGRSAVTCSDNGKHLLMRVGKKPVLQYNHAEVPSPNGLPQCFRRSGYIHPVFTPSGRQVTDDFPPDHAHQHAIFFAYVKSRFDGRQIDFWNQKKMQGRICHMEIERTADGPVFAECVVRLRHDDQTDPKSPKAVLNETWTLRVYSLSDYHVFDLISRQTCSGEQPLLVMKNHYGGMAFRGSRQWFPGKDEFLTSEGKRRSDGNGTRPRWVQAYGPIDGETCAATVMCHPENLRFPQPVRLHPSKPYFCFAPMLLGDFAIEPGKPLVSKYRFCIHDEKPNDAECDRLFRDYANPPRVRVVTAKR